MNQPEDTNRDGAQERTGGRLSTGQRLIRFGALAAVLSAVLAVTANLSEIAGWFAPDETRELVEETRETIAGTDAKVEELLVLLRNQAMASGADLTLESEAAVRYAVQAIIDSGNAQKRDALEALSRGDVTRAATTMARLAADQTAAVEKTGDVAAESWLEAGALYLTHDFGQAIEAYRRAADLRPGDGAVLAKLGLAHLRAGDPASATSAFERALSGSPGPEVRSAAHLGLGRIARQRGEYAEAEEHLRIALDATPAETVTAERVLVLDALGQLDRARGRFDSADAHLTEALRLAEQLGNASLQADITLDLGILDAEAGHYDRAGTRMREALEIHRQRNDPASEAEALGKLGGLELLRGNTDRARELLEQTVAAKERLEWDASVVYDLINLGTLAATADDFASAGAHFERAEKIAEAHELLELVPVIRYNRGEMALNAGDQEAACAFFAEAVPRLKSMGSQHAATASHRRADFCR